MQTPMIAWFPKQIEPGTVTDRVGHLVYFLPTMLELAGAEAPEKLPGHSLLPALKGESTERLWPLYWQFGRSRAIRDQDWKLVKHGNRQWELYNLKDDPTELVDLAEANPQRVQQMASAWEQWWETGHPKKV